MSAVAVVVLGDSTRPDAVVTVCKIEIGHQVRMTCVDTRVDDRHTSAGTAIRTLRIGDGLLGVNAEESCAGDIDEGEGAVGNDRADSSGMREGGHGC